MKYLAVFLVSVFCCGCLVVGQGSMYGYVTAVEDNIIWSKVYFKTDLQSSDSDVFTVRKSNMNLKETLEGYAENGKRVKIRFNNH